MGCRLVVNMKKAFYAVLVLLLGLLCFTGCADKDKPPKESCRYFMTSEQETQREDDIEAFLKSANLYRQGYTGVHVNSGYEKLLGEEVTETVKTEIIIFVPTKIASDFSEAKALSDGYYAAMLLYFGENDAGDYDITFQVFDDNNETVYEFKNGVFTD